MSEQLPSSMPSAPAPPPSRTPDRSGGTRPGLRFSARDLVNVAIFAVITYVVVFAIAMLGIISPLVMLFTLPLSAIAAGIPYMLFVTRVRHPGMVTLFGLVLGLLFMMTGHPWQSLLLTIALSVLADLILFSGRYRSRWAGIVAYTVFSAWFIGPWIPLFLDREEYLREHLSDSMGTQYAAQFATTVTVPALLIMAAASVVCGFLGALLGTAMLRKHFVRAGLA